MSVVANIGAIKDRFDTLGWQPPLVNQSDLIETVKSAGLAGSVIAAYLDALIATPVGLNDQTISGVTPQQGSAITTFLKGKGALV